MVFAHPLELTWGIFIAYCIVMYVILDGFTLGTGIMLPFLSDQDADIGMSVILPTWDGNQTWLVLGLACLYGAFPLAFGVLLPVLYLPLLFIVLSLLLRGVAFEFRLKEHDRKKAWTWVFFSGSLIATFIQGMIVGDFVKGYQFDYVHKVIVNHHILTPFTVFTGCSLVIGYLLLGSTRLVLKTEGPLQQKMYRLALRFTVLFALCIVTVSLWSPYANVIVACSI